MFWSTWIWLGDRAEQCAGKERAIPPRELGPRPARDNRPHRPFITVWKWGAAIELLENGASGPTMGGPLYALGGRPKFTALRPDHLGPACLTRENRSGLRSPVRSPPLSRPAVGND